MPNSTEVAQQTVSENRTESNKTESKKYQSGKLLLSTMQKENDLEIDNKKTLETRASTLIAFVGVILVLFINNFNLSVLDKIESRLLYAIIFILTLVIPLASFGTTLYNLFRVMDTRPYRRINLINKDLVSLSDLTEEEVALRFSRAYQEGLKENVTTNDQKKRNFKIGLYGLLITIVSVAIALAILNTVNYISK
ncbi:hypothetical protein [Brevibacillus nitrificans]|uniref:hypothetical protein n=1 Tax=Brevibacillus nitrificans TaxID=651560 RepID=UPI00261F0958|nr:hypothetical protein [Brevibacillus nitrificans]MED1795160.1 hypothetical protein [Brevibacillus nitrificans]